VTAESLRRIGLLVLLSAVLKLGFLAAPRTDLLGQRESGAAKAFQVHGEEASRAAIAIEVREGPLLPIGDYQWTHFFGGSLVVGLAAIPFLEVFGDNFFALKLVPLCFELAFVAFGYLLLLRLFGRRTALIGGSMLAVSSPGQALLSTLAWGSHSSLNAFVMAGLLTYVASLPSAKHEIGRRREFAMCFLFGALSGFGVWFGYGYVLVLVAVFAFAFLRDPRFLLRQRSVMTGLGFLLGLAPWLSYNLRHDFAGMSIAGEELGRHFSLLDVLLDLPARLFLLFTDLIPGSLGHRAVGPLPGSVLAAVVTIALIGLAGCGLWYLRKSLRAALVGALRGGSNDIDPALLLAFHLFAYCGAMLFSDFFPAGNQTQIAEYRYLAPCFPGLIGLAAFGVDRLIDAGARRRSWALAALALVLVPNLLGHTTLIQRDQFGALWNLDADRREGHGRWMALRWAHDNDRMVELTKAVIERRDPEPRDRLLTGMADGLHVIIQRQEKWGGPYYDIDELESLRETLVETLPPPHGERFRDPRPQRRRQRTEASGEPDSVEFDGRERPR
jgi:hypothetical protein